MKFFWDNTYLTRDERSKLYLLLFIFILLCLFKFYAVVFYQPSSTPIAKHILDSVEMVSLTKKERYYSNKKYTISGPPNKRNEESERIRKTKKSADNSAPLIFSFDPNKIGRDSLRLLGFSTYATNSLLKYRSKGGVIRSIEQMSKINGLSNETLTRLIPLVVLKDYKQKQYSYNTIKNNEIDSTQSTTKKKNYKRKSPRFLKLTLEIRLIL